MFKQILIIMIAAPLMLWANGTSSSHPLTFKDWKRIQIHDSRLKVVELSELIGQKSANAVPTEMAGNIESAAAEGELRRRQDDLKAALENLQYSKELTFKDYFDVYLVKFAGNEVALEHIAKRLSRESVALLLKKSLKMRPSLSKQNEPQKQNFISN